MRDGIDTEFRKAYKALKDVVMADRVAPDENSVTTEWINRDHNDGAIKGVVEVLRRILDENPQGVDGISQADFIKAKAFLLDVLDLIGVYSEKHAAELLEKESVWLEEAREHLKTDQVELALAKLWLCLRVAEEHYRRSEYAAARDSVEKIWELVKGRVEASKDLLSLLMLGLTEDKVKELELPDIRKEHKRAGEYKTLRAGERIWACMAERSPEYAEDLLSLLGRLGLTEGKINIRLMRYSHADVSLEQSLRSTAAWCQLKLSKLSKELTDESRKIDKVAGARKTRAEKASLLGQRPGRDVASEVIHAENFAHYRIAVAQCYLAYSYYRRGRFRRALTQVIAARYTLNCSNWVFSSIFADMIHAGAERRLAGIHNEERVNEVKELCEKTVKFFDAKVPEGTAKILEGATAYTPGQTDRGSKLSPTFLLRACYEIGICCYYLAEIRENELKEGAAPDRQQAIRKDLGDYIDEARRYAGIIVGHAEKMSANEGAFWLANGRHLEAFVAMKEPGRAGNVGGRETEDAFAKAIKLIEQASESARESKSKWQLTDILIDHAYILNASARYYDEQAGRDGKDRKGKLAKAALNLLAEALVVARQMAEEEGLDEPHSNFSGQIYLYMADSYALLGNKPEALRNYTLWHNRQNEVEYSRAVDLSEDVRSRVELIDQTLVINFEEGLCFAEHEAKLKRWLIEKAIEKGGSYTEAIKLLGVSRATFYAWKDDLFGKS